MKGVGKIGHVFLLDFDSFLLMGKVGGGKGIPCSLATYGCLYRYTQLLFLLF